jgi:hypothetical protein
MFTDNLVMWGLLSGVFFFVAAWIGKSEKPAKSRKVLLRNEQPTTEEGAVNVPSEDVDVVIADARDALFRAKFSPIVSERTTYLTVMSYVKELREIMKRERSHHDFSYLSYRIADETKNIQGMKAGFMFRLPVWYQNQCYRDIQEVLDTLTENL